MRILPRLPKVRDYLEWYLDWYEAEHPTTISKAKSEVKRFIERFGHRPIDSIRAVEVEQYKRVRLLDDRAAKETVGKEIRRLKAAFNRSVEWKELDVNPLASVKAPRGVRSVAVKFYDRAAMRRLYRANPGRAPLWLFMAHTGLRRGEHRRASAQVAAHVLRTHMMMAGVPLRRVQILAGHADYATIEKYYAHLSPDGDDGAVSRLKF